MGDLARSDYMDLLLALLDGLAIVRKAPFAGCWLWRWLMNSLNRLISGDHTAGARMNRRLDVCTACPEQGEGRVLGATDQGVSVALCACTWTSCGPGGWSD